MQMHTSPVLRRLKATYDFLSKHRREASELIRTQYAEKPLWLNLNYSLECLSGENSRPTVLDCRPISTLMWLKATSLVHNYLHDSPNQQLYSVKKSIEPYRNLLLACGSHEYNDPDREIALTEDHAKNILEGIREMQRSPDNLYDTRIIVSGERFEAHSLLLATVSSCFRALLSDSWETWPNRVLNLEEGM